MSLLQDVSHTFSTQEVCVILLYGGFILLLILFGWDLLERYIKADKRMRGDAAYKVFFIIAIAMIGYGIYTGPATVNYFLEEGLTAAGMNLGWLNPFQIMFLCLMIVPIAYVCVSIAFRKLKILGLIVGIIGILMTLSLLIITIVAINDPTANLISIYYTKGVQYSQWALIGIFGLADFVGIIFIMIVKLAPQKEVRKKILYGIVGIVIAGIGGFFEVSQREHGSWLYVFGVLIELIGFLVMRFFFLSIPSYDEFAWKSGMIELHIIIAETGISLHHRSFSEYTSKDLKGDITVTATIPESEIRPNSDLVAGGLVGIKGMLAEISGDKGKLEHISIGTKSLVFKQGRVALCLLLANENLGVYHSMLDDLVRLVEDHHPDLENFSGDTRTLHIEPLVNQVFGVDSPIRTEEED